VARCDYADQFKFQDRPSDVPEALRDFVLLPSAEGTEATLVVVDRADTTSEKRAMHLRFRVPSPFGLEGDTASSRIGGTRLEITNVARTGGTIMRASPRDGKDCFAEGIQKGKCDAARMPVTDFRVMIPGPKPRAVHTLSATNAAKPTTSKLGGPAWSGVKIGGVREAVVVWPNAAGSAFDYTVARGAAVTHVVLDVDKPAITAKLDGESCAVSVKSGGDAAVPAIVTLDTSCNVVPDPPAAGAAPTAGLKPQTTRSPNTTSKRSGCCAAQTTPPGSSIVMAFVVAVFLLRSRRSRR
jgi:hypothetical protein